MDSSSTKRPGSQPGSPDMSDHHRSRQDSGHLSCSFQQTVKEAVAIAAGKKGSGSKEDDGRKTFRSNMLCYLYWLLVILILGLISFTVWLSIQLARRHSDAISSQSKSKHSFIHSFIHSFSQSVSQPADRPTDRPTARSIDR